MNNDTSPIAQAIESLKSKRPRPRGKKAALAPFVPALRDLVAAGWTRTEIVREIRAMGGRVSPALLRDVLALPTEDRRKRNHWKPKIDPGET